MRIIITQRLRPFTHLPGMWLQIPGTALRMQCYPALLRIQDQASLLNIALTLPTIATGYTVSQDLENGCVRIWQRHGGNFLCYRLQATVQGQLTLLCERGELTLTIGSVSRTLKAKESLDLLALSTPPTPTPRERLSLGSHRLLDAFQMRNALDLHALVPIWLRLGQWVPAPDHTDYSGTALLLRDLVTLQREEVYSGLQTLVRIGFEGLFCPRLIDGDHQGIPLSEPTEAESPLILLSAGARFLRSLVIRQTGYSLNLLPQMPPQFHCGRMTGIDCAGLGTLDIEWTKKTLRRMIFRPNQSHDWSLQFPKALRQYRLRQSAKDSGVVHLCSDLVTMEKDREYWFDRFM